LCDGGRMGLLGTIYAVMALNERRLALLNEAINNAALKAEELGHAVQKT